MTRTVTAAGLLIGVLAWVVSPVFAADDAVPKDRIDAALDEALKGIKPLLPSSVFDIHRKAKAFAAEHGPASIPHLLKRARKWWSVYSTPGVFCFLALGQLSADATARDFLREWSLREHPFWKSPLVTISFMPAERALPLAEVVLLENKDHGARVSAGQFLVWLGDADTLKRLKQAKPEDAVKADLARTVAGLEKWLKRFPDEKTRRDWARQEILFWQAIRCAPQYRADRMMFRFAADSLVKQGEPFSIEFLKAKLSGSYEEKSVAAYLLEMRKELSKNDKNPEIIEAAAQETKGPVEKTDARASYLTCELRASSPRRQAASCCSRGHRGGRRIRGR